MIKENQLPTMPLIKLYSLNVHFLNMSRSPDRISNTIEKLQKAFETTAYFTEFKLYEDWKPEKKDELLLSVIIPARNEFPNIVHTIHSILNCWEADGFKPEDIEIIVVNNCSTDYNDPKFDWSKPGDRGTTEHLMPRGIYYSQTLRVLYDPIAGNHSARNKGVRMARGKYVFFSDAHMSYKPGTFKFGLQACEESGGLVHCGIAWMGGYPPRDSSVGMQYTIKLGEEWKGCVDEKTEILTKDGWKKYNQIDKKTEFATYNKEKRIINFERTTSITKTHYKGKMIEFKGRSIDQLLTPNHRSLYSHSENGKWEIRPADSVKRKNHIPTGTNGVPFYCGQYDSYSREFIQLLGWIIAEGCYEKDTITITQFKEEGRKEIEDLLKYLKISYCIKDKKRDFKIHQNDTKKIRKVLPEKKLAKELVFGLGRIRLQILFDTLIKAEGTITGKNQKFYQADSETLESFQILCTLLGKASR